MLQKGTTQKLDSRVLLYRLLGGVIGNFILSVFLTAIPFFIMELVRKEALFQFFSASTFQVWVLVMFVFVNLMIYLGWKFFEYTITDSNITIRSGVVSRTVKSVNFNDLQNAQAQYGPVSLLFGVKNVVAYSASPSQVTTYTDKNGTHTVITPDVSITLLSQDAEDLVSLMRQGDVQKVAL